MPLEWLASAPPWFCWTYARIGMAEIPGRKSNPAILKLQDQAKMPGSYTDDSDYPYCAVGVNAALEETGFRGTRSGMARSFERDKNFQKLDKPRLGSIAVCWRGSRGGGSGHVGFARAHSKSHVYILGFNQGDALNVKAFPKDGGAFGLVGFWWPKNFTGGATTRYGVNPEDFPLLPVATASGEISQLSKVT